MDRTRTKGMESVSSIMPSDRIKKFNDRMTILCSISDKVRLDWEDGRCHMYSMLGMGDDIHGFCSYSVDAAQVWVDPPEEGTYIFYTGKKMLDSIKHWDSDRDLTWSFERRSGSDFFHNLSVTDGDLLVPFVSAYSTDVTKVTPGMIRQKLDQQDGFELRLSVEQYDKVKKLLRSKSMRQTTATDEDTVRITAREGEIVLASGWELRFDSDQDLPNGNYYFKAKYLDLIKKLNDDLRLFIHDTYVSVQLEDDAYYMFPMDIM